MDEYSIVNIGDKLVCIESFSPFKSGKILFDKSCIVEIYHIGETKKRRPDNIYHRVKFIKSGIQSKTFTFYLYSKDFKYFESCIEKRKRIIDYFI